MRWLWIDKFEAFEPGVCAVAVKNVTAAEEHLHDLYPGFPVYPNTLVLEGMAQTAGILVGETRGFREKVILAKVGRADFHRVVRPGDTLRLRADVEVLDVAGASVTGTVTCDDRPVADVSLMFSHLDANQSGMKFPEENFVFNAEFLKILQAFRRGLPPPAAT